MVTLLEKVDRLTTGKDQASAAAVREVANSCARLSADVLVDGDLDQARTFAQLFRRCSEWLDRIDQ